MTNFSAILISWYHENKRDLPWRHTKDPYHIWLSEVMLQQTRVEQGLPYYLKFLDLFPSVFDLAAASEDQVLNAWKGLGYYSRARRLHATAKHTANDSQGRFPKSFAELKKLPGVGDYTAAAVASFCFKEAVPVVDGNVYRVLSRMFNIDSPIDKPSGKKEFFELASVLIDQNKPDEFNQAIMEFGALQCVPKKLNCQPCPFVESCEAFSLDKVAALPVKSRKIKRTVRYFNYLLIRQDNQYLAVKRNDDGIWANMQEFPMVETSDKVHDQQQMEKLKMKGVPFNFVVGESRDYQKHVLTHQHIFYTFWTATISKKVDAPFKFYTKAQLNEMPFPKLLEKFISNL